MGGTTMKSYATKILVLIWVIGLLFSVPLHAQVAGATLTGTITDAQGGAVANAKVSARNGATGVVTETVGAKQELSLALKVGEITQTVEITGAAPIIETTNATLSGNVESAQIV